MKIVVDTLLDRGVRFGTVDEVLSLTVNDQEWDALRSAVKTTYQNSLRCLADLSEWDERKAGMAVGLIAHTAYHLGSIRQLAKSVKSV